MIPYITIQENNILLDSRIFLQRGASSFLLLLQEEIAVTVHFYNFNSFDDWICN